MPAPAAGVMMIPIPREGIYVDVEGLEQARTEPGIEDVIITAKQGQKLRPVARRRQLPGFHLRARRNAGWTWSGAAEFAPATCALKSRPRCR